jgi:transcriptional regulator with GAF, ATPase, and Fis domain
MPSPESSRAPTLDGLARFSERVLEVPDPTRLRDELVDAAIEATRAEVGLVLRFEGTSRAVRAARSRGGVALDAAPLELSEGAIQRARESRRAVVADDGDRGVMCAPLVQGAEVFGALYLRAERGARFDEGALGILTVFAAQGSLLLQDAHLVEALRRENVALKEAAAVRQYGDLIGAGAGMREVYRRIEKVAATDVSVLISGETGTGKEVVAREIHRRSTRASGPFVAVSCGAIPEALLESELFGHVKGSFTGATANRQGRFQAASGGTLFLDEIGEMPGNLQVKLLRALQDRAVTRIGDEHAEPVDIRVLAATHRVLEDEIRAGAFREDLYYRLNVVSIRLPPLRERVEDVPVIARFFLQKYAREFSSRVRSYSPAAIAAMKKYAWPGNIRELENRVKKAVVLAEKALVGPEDLDLRPEELAPILPLNQAKDEFQRRYINEVLERNGGNRTKTAKDLGVDPRTIFRHLESERTGHRPAEP